MLITNINTNNKLFTTCNIIKINSLDLETRTYKSSECYSENIEDILDRISTNNVYNIKEASIARKGDRKHTAKYFKIPNTDIIRVYSYGEAYWISNENKMEVYTQCDGQEYLLIGKQSYVVFVRLYVISHDLDDNTIPYYFDRKGNRVSELSFKYDMFFSDYEQAYYKKKYIYDATNILKIFIEPENDKRNNLIY